MEWNLDTHSSNIPFIYSITDITFFYTREPKLVTIFRVPIKEETHLNKKNKILEQTSYLRHRLLAQYDYI